jgi:hypothetical protein
MRGGDSWIVPRDFRGFEGVLALEQVVVREFSLSLVA